MINVYPRNADFYIVAASSRRAIGGLLALIISGSMVSAPCSDDRAELLRQRHEQLRQKWEMQFRAADTNNDRKLSRTEMEAAKMPESLIKHFDEIDTDHDGALTPEEMMAAYDKRLADQQPKTDSQNNPDEAR